MTRMAMILCAQGWGENHIFNRAVLIVVVGENHQIWNSNPIIQNL
jgi:hypothetical protein